MKLRLFCDRSLCPPIALDLLTGDGEWVLLKSFGEFITYRDLASSLQELSELFTFGPTCGQSPYLIPFEGPDSEIIKQQIYRTRK